jgi:hypothetical protein
MSMRNLNFNREASVSDVQHSTRLNPVAGTWVWLKCPCFIYTFLTMKFGDSFMLGKVMDILDINVLVSSNMQSHFSYQTVFSFQQFLKYTAELVFQMMVGVVLMYSLCSVFLVVLFYCMQAKSVGPDDIK